MIQYIFMVTVSDTTNPKHYRTALKIMRFNWISLDPSTKITKFTTTVEFSMWLNELGFSKKR